MVLGLIEPDFEEYGPLVHIGVHSIWRILELHGTVSMNQICRLLSGAGLAQRLVSAMGSAISYSRDLKVSLILAAQQMCLLCNKFLGLS